jgi:hypothetical protein
MHRIPIMSKFPAKIMRLFIFLTLSQCSGKFVSDKVKKICFISE